MKCILRAFLVSVIALNACRKDDDANRVTRVDVKLLDKSGMAVSDDTVREYYNVKTVPDPSVGFPPNPFMYSEHQITNAAGMATFLIPDSVFRYQSSVEGLYMYRTDSGALNNGGAARITLNKGSYAELTFRSN